MRTQPPIPLPIVAILCGGMSAEHEISLLSAQNIFQAIDRTRYQPVLIGVDAQGQWWYSEIGDLIAQGKEGGLPQLAVQQAARTVLVPGGKGKLLAQATGETLAQLSAAFPILHGPMGEDGSLQGLLELAQVPFVGADVLGSAVAMDKDVMKRLLRAADLPVGDWWTVCAANLPTYEVVVERLGSPFFVKPANMGSSIGIHKVDNAADYEATLTDALKYDRKLLLERFIAGRELECAVLGNVGTQEASLPGEIEAHDDFYSYQAKYLDPNGAGLQVPALLAPEQIIAVQQLAVQACDVLCCEGMARVDLFLQQDGTLLINEINTLPGFTAISLYPQMWEKSGLSCTELITRLIQLAEARFQRRQALLHATG